MFNKLNKIILPSWLIFNIDLFLSFFSIILSYLLRFNFRIPDFYASSLSIVIVFVVIIRAISFFISGTHKVTIRHISISDFFVLTIVVFSGSAVLLLMNFFYFYFISRVNLIPLSIILIDFFISTYLFFIVRIVTKFFFLQLSYSLKTNINVLIYGTKNLAVAVKRAMELDHESNYKVQGFIHHNIRSLNKSLDGLAIYNAVEIEPIIDRLDIKKIVFAESKIPIDLKNAIIESCLNKNVKVFNVRNVSNWIREGFEAPKFKEIKIEDLLERDPIVLDTTTISANLNDKCVLITGAAGSIGSEIVRQILHFRPAKILLVDQAETQLYNLEQELIGHNVKCDVSFIISDITDSHKMRKIFRTHKIDVIYHAAAYKHVPMMEFHPDEAVRNNVIGTRILADLSLEYKVSEFVMISTDKAVNPTNVMGASKRIAEMYTQALFGRGKTCFITTRFGNVLGSNGSVIPLFKMQIESGGPVTVTHPDVTRFFMTIPEACQLVLEASVMGKGGEIFIFDMGKSVKIVDLAKNMIRLAGYEIDKDIKIKYVGLRPGEKLFEELLNTKENTLPTHHSKIMIARVNTYKYETISRYIDQLADAVIKKDNFSIVRLMKEIVPEFKSMNSIYERIDKELSDDKQRIIVSTLT